MTVEQLVEILYTMPQDAQVAVNVREDQGILRTVKLYTNTEDLPYSKGDNVRNYDMPDDIVFLSDQKENQNV